MDLKKKRTRPKEDPICKVDPETGKLTLLPLKLSSITNSIYAKSSGKKFKRTFIAPLNLTAADFEDKPSRAGKVRTDNSSVRKGLFSLPIKRSWSNRPSIHNPQSMSRKSIATKEVQSRKFNYCESSLLDMEVVEEEVINTKGCIVGYPFKVSKPEKMCCTDDIEKENDCNRSPISSVCDLLEDTRLNNIKKQNKFSAHTINITMLENIIEQNTIAVEQFKTSHEQNIKKIAELLEVEKERYDNLIAIQEENASAISEILTALKRSSTYVCNQIENQVMRHEDLRKSTLNKNFVTISQQYLQSPRLQKALNMYNMMRNEIPILTTPRLDRHGLFESPKTTNLSRSLSRRIQNQCHLLQDTPAHK